MKKTKIYISLPISGQETKAREKADIIKTALSKKGFLVVSPFDIYPGKDPLYEDHLCSDLRALMDCDAVYFCIGWDKSCGCGIEHDVVMRFKAYGKKDFKVMYEPE
ncbi:MAG: DUF4406 domain-containing protein [Muribaculaceae bacterium]|nr:DUF4406 domain-containing protein [Muribaculaceae bacterium]